MNKPVEGGVFYLLVIVAMLSAAVFLPLCQVFILINPVDQIARFYGWTCIAFALLGGVNYLGLVATRRILRPRPDADHLFSAVPQTKAANVVAWLLRGYVGGLGMAGWGLLVVGGLLLAIFVPSLVLAGWAFARPLFDFGALFVVSGIWPYAAARLFPWDFPGRTL